MKKIISASLALILMCAFAGCERYPQLYYYIKVEDASGNSLLAEKPQPGKISPQDIAVECVKWDTLKGGPDVADGINGTFLDVEPVRYYVILDKRTPYLLVNANAQAGVHRKDCPDTYIYWPDGTCDTLRVDDSVSSLAIPDFFINGGRQEDDQGFITVVKSATRKVDPKERLHYPKEKAK